MNTTKDSVNFDINLDLSGWNEAFQGVARILISELPRISMAQAMKLIEEMDEEMALDELDDEEKMYIDKALALLNNLKELENRCDGALQVALAKLDADTFCEVCSAFKLSYVELGRGAASGEVVRLISDRTRTFLLSRLIDELSFEVIDELLVMTYRLLGEKEEDKEGEALLSFIKYTLINLVEEVWVTVRGRFFASPSREFGGKGGNINGAV